MHRSIGDDNLSVDAAVACGMGVTLGKFDAQDGFLTGVADDIVPEQDALFLGDLLGRVNITRSHVGLEENRGALLVERAHADAADAAIVGP